MSTYAGKLAASAATVVLALTMSTLAPSQAFAASPYDRPNAMHCIAHGVSINAPTNVPVISGEVLWQAEVQVYNTVTKQWEAGFYSPHFKNLADRVQVTAGPWYDSDGSEHYQTMAAMNSGTGQIQIRVYNHFWRADQGQWVYVDNGWFSTIDGTATGPDTCILSNGAYVA